MLTILASVGLAASIEVVKVAAVPERDPASAEWGKAAAVTVPLMPQQAAYPMNPTASVPQVKVQALADDKSVAFRVEWADTTVDDKVEIDHFTDGVALQIPLGDPAKTNPMMGGEGAPVYLVNWKAVWQHDVEHGHADVQDYHPNFYTDAYPFATGEYPYPVAESFETSDGRRYLVATSAGNPISVLHRRWPIEELTAEGFGTLATQPIQDARGWGVHKDGKWAVVFTLPRTTDDPSNPVLGPGARSALSFAVWEGGARNVGGRKHWAMFTDLVLP